MMKRLKIFSVWEDKSTIIKKTRNIFAENIEENKITKLRLQKWNVAPRKKNND